MALHPCACGRPDRADLAHSRTVCSTIPLVEGQVYRDGTSGHSGSEASEDRAREMDASGTTGRLQRATLNWLRQRQRMGGTQAELQGHLGVGHGTASQVLSTLHQAGKVERLAARRLRSHIYVMPRDVAGRETSGYRRLQSREVLRRRIADLEEALRELIETESTPDTSVERARAVLNDRIEP